MIMATAAASPGRVRRMEELGCLAVVPKPMDEASFLEIVGDALNV